MDVYKSLNSSIGTVMKNPEMIKLFLIILKLKKMSKHGVGNLPYLLRHVPDQCKTQQMFDKAILKNSGTLKSVPDCYKDQGMCNKAIDNYPNALEFVSKCYKTQNMCDKSVNTYPSTIKFVPECFMI